MILAIEDTLSEVLIRKLVKDTRPDLTISTVLTKKGKGYLRSKARELNRVARSVPVFLVVDLDTPEPCPIDLITRWFNGEPEQNMLFRVAVMEIESWILADRSNCADFLAIPRNRIPMDTDAIDNPKELLINLARRSRRRDIRDDIVPSEGAITWAGPAYTSRVASFVTEHWNSATASQVSRSLTRAIVRLADAFR